MNDDRLKLAQAIDRDLATRTWGDAYETRARKVIDWCQGHEIDTSSITAEPLRAAMGQMPYWNQGPSNYLDMVFAISAFLRARI